MQILFVIDDNERFLAGCLVVFVLHGHSIDDVVKFNLTRFLGDDRHVIGIPLGKYLSLFDLASVGNTDD